MDILSSSGKLAFLTPDWSECNTFATTVVDITVAIAGWGDWAFQQTLTMAQLKEDSELLSPLTKAPYLPTNLRFRVHGKACRREYPRHLTKSVPIDTIHTYGLCQMSIFILQPS